MADRVASSEVAPGVSAYRRFARSTATLLTTGAVIFSAIGCEASVSNPAPSPIAASDASAPELLPNAGVGRKTKRPEAQAVGISLRSITVTRKGDHDQAVFEYTGAGVPGWAVQFVSSAIQNGTGKKLPIPGGSVLEVLLIEAAAPISAGGSYAGPNVISSRDAKQIQVVTYSATKAGVTQAFIGVRGKQPAFAVSALTNPTRIVVDVAD